MEGPAAIGALATARLHGLTNHIYFIFKNLYAGMPCIAALFKIFQL
jgi:hypothetical protein